MRALRLTSRFVHVLFVLLWALTVYAFRRGVAWRLTPAQRERLRGEILAATLERLGATYIKFGQILSTRPDLFGPGITDALARLQDRVPPFAFAVVEQVVSEDLNAPARQRLQSIDPEPIAAASVAQVHRARLDTGEVVALKVQRPKARAQVERDLLLMAWGARLADRLPNLRLLSLPGSIERFAEAMHGQLDFRLEAANNRRFAANFAKLEGVGVPALYSGLCTERVLAMELIEGVKATDPARVGGDRAKLARRGLKAILQMVFEDGFVHADLHPGNILLTDEDEVILIDLGLVAEIADDLRRPWIETFVALAGQDGALAARLFYGYAPAVGPIDYDAFESEVQAAFESLDGKALNELEASKVLMGMMNVLRRHRVQIDPVFTVVNLAMLVAEGLGKQLDPSLDLIAEATPYLAKALASAPTPRPPLRAPPD